MSEALSLPAVVAAFDIEAVEPDERPELTRRCLQIHARVMEIHKVRARMTRHG